MEVPPWLRLLAEGSLSDVKLIPLRHARQEN
jgi:hypothetical protein